jgi:hypothetical protein
MNLFDSGVDALVELRSNRSSKSELTGMPPGWQTEELAEEWIEDDDQIASGMFSIRDYHPCFVGCSCCRQSRQLQTR